MWQAPDPKYNETVWRIVRQIPAGRVSTYGQIAGMIPPRSQDDPDSYKRLGPRWVGNALNNLPDTLDDPVPWQRVINSQGKISLGGTTGQTQRQRLEAEGIGFAANGQVDLATYGWHGPDDTWLEIHDLLPPDVFEAKPKQNRLF